MFSLVAEHLPLLVVASHLLLLILILAILSRDGWGRGIYDFLSRYTLLLSLGVALIAMLGSLFYSVILGFEPCVLCWWLRVLLFPLVVILGLAWWRGDRGVFFYTTPLVILAGVVALYQSYANLGGVSLLECTSAEGACAKLYVYEYGYITIPTMALTAVVYLLVLHFVNKLHENRHA